jgi:hypothetical protein
MDQQDFGSATIIPQGANSSLWGNYKRRREPPSLSPFSSHPIISQEEADVDEMDVATSPVAKRARPCHEEVPSPGVVSVASDYQHYHYSMPSDDDTKTPWWKQASAQRQHSISSIDPFSMDAGGGLVCFVCESVFTPKEEETQEESFAMSSLSSSSCNASGSLSLLDYFSCTTPRKHQPNVPPPPRSPKGDACTFCERAPCPECLMLCEECCQSFCTFCCTNDYVGAYSRTVCLDCVGQEEEKVADDAMQMDSM